MTKQKRIAIIATIMVLITVSSTLGYFAINHLIPLDIVNVDSEISEIGYTTILLNSTSWWANYELSQGGTTNRYDKSSELSVGKDIRLGSYIWKFRSVIQFDNIESMLPKNSEQYEILEANLTLYPTTSTDTEDSRNPIIGWDFYKLKNNNSRTENWVEDTNIGELSYSWVGKDHPLGVDRVPAYIWIMAEAGFPMTFDLTSDVKQWHSEFVSGIPSTNNGWVFKLNSENYDTRSQFPVNIGKNEGDIPKLVIKWERSLPVNVNLGVFPDNFINKGISIFVTCPKGFYNDPSTSQLIFPIDGTLRSFYAWNGTSVTFSVDKTRIDDVWWIKKWIVSGVDSGVSLNWITLRMNLSDGGSYNIVAKYIDESRLPSSVTILFTTGGTVSPKGIVDGYREGSTINIVATADNGYRFDYLTRNGKKVINLKEGVLIAQISSSKTTITIMDITVKEGIKVYFINDDLLSKILGEWLPFEIAGIIVVAALVIFVKRVQRKQVTK